MGGRGRIYAVGVGPGDPEYMTLKACRIIRECSLVAVPVPVSDRPLAASDCGKPEAGDRLPGAYDNEKFEAADPRSSAAYRIAAAAVPELNDKECIGLSMPMVRDRNRLYTCHRAAADRLERLMDQGKSIVYLALGDVTLYCTFSYLQSILEEDGYSTSLISGVSSISAAAARLNMPLVTGNEQLHVLPGIFFADGTGARSGVQTGTGAGSLDANYKTEMLSGSSGILSGLSGTCVIMKSGRCMKDVRRAAAESGKLAAAVENCGMADERVYYELDEIPDDAGYFTTIIVKDQ